MRDLLNLLGILFAYAAYAFGVRRSVTYENLRLAYPELATDDINILTKKTYRNLGIVFAEMLYLRFASKNKIESQIHVTNPEVFHEADRFGKGLIVVAGHISNWEWLALGGALVLKKNFFVVQKNIRTSFTDGFLQRMRVRSGNSLINSGDIRKMYRTLSLEGCIAMLADQAAPSESAQISFFGRPTPTFEGPARLALRTRAPLLFAECTRTIDSQYSVTFSPVEFGDLQNDSTDNINLLTARHTALLESSIRKHPDQWLWQHRRWKYSQS